MASRSLKLGMLLTVLLTAGCFNSDSDYQRLMEEKNTLETELQAANQENEILTQALANISQEQKELQTLLDASQNRLKEAAATAPSAGSAADSTSSRTSSPRYVDFVEPPSRQSTASDSQTTPPRAENRASSQSSSNSSGQRIYRPKDGDVLVTIARKHNTTLEKLLELNPQLRNRTNYMIWTTDKIVLPD